MSFTFLQGVNRLFRKEGVIGIDDSDITSFSSTQHAATLELAQQAIQDEITYLSAEFQIPVEQTSATVTTSANTRVYELASDFLEFTDEKPFLLEVDASGDSENVWIGEYPGGEDRLRLTFLDYREQTNTPQYFYWVRSTGKKIGFYPVPDAAKTYRYYYEQSNQVTVSSDTLPVANRDEFHAFISICARRFKYLSASMDVRASMLPPEVDPIAEAARASLIGLHRHKKHPTKYGRRYA